MPRNILRSFMVALTALTLVGPVAVTATASEDPIGVIWAKDFSLRTLRIGQDTYHLTDTTTLSTRLGQRLAFVKIPVAVDQNGWLRGLAQATVQYRSHERRGRLYLDSLQLVVPPE